VSGVYVRERYCVGGLAVSGIMDSRGREPGSDLRTIGCRGAELGLALELEEDS
jgi:hypothetical protein